jgi:hypothetical protein
VKLYRGRVRPMGLAFYEPRDTARVEEHLRSSVLSEVLHGAVLLADEDYIVHLRLSENPSAEEVGQVAVTLETLGYQWINGQVVSYLTRALECGAGGFFGGGAAGSRAGETASLVTAVVLGLAGLWIGSTMKRYEPLYTVQRTYRGWALVPATPS